LVERAQRTALSGLERRERERALRVYATPAERMQIQASAKAAGMSVSEYMRSVSLNYAPESHFDREVVLTLVRGYGDLRKMTEQLNQRLSERPDDRVWSEQVGRLLDELTQATRSAGQAAGAAGDAFDALRRARG